MASTSQWLDTAAASVVLGISARQLRHLRCQGVFKLGKHYRTIGAPNAARPTYQWHCDRITQTLGTPMEKRS